MRQPAETDPEWAWDMLKTEMEFVKVRCPSRAETATLILIEKIEELEKRIVELEKNGVRT